MILRIVLFLGLVAHKLVWEVMKRRDGAPNSQRPSAPPTLAARLVKWFKVAVLLAIVVQTLFLDLLPISDDPALLQAVGTIIYFVGLGTAVIGRMQLGKNWANLEDYQVIADQSLVTDGIYRYIRHPIYTGDFLLLVGLELALNSWLVLGAVLLFVFIWRQARTEEAVLSQAFPNYHQYRQRTKMLIPFLL